MKQAMLYGPRDLRIEEHPLDTESLGPHQIWVQTEITALKIGTDRGNYEGAAPVPGSPPFPRGVGDSNLGVVRAVGEKVTRFQPGDRVFRNYWHTSDYLAEESDPLVRVPPGVAAEDAVYTGLYNLCALSYRRAHYQPGENVAVVGLGVLGMGEVALGRAYGARVVGLGNSPIRLEMARRMGAHEALLSDDPELSEKLDDFTQGMGIDLVILTANPWPAYRTSMEIVRHNGRVAILSLPGRGEPELDFNPLAMEWFYYKAMTLIAVSGATPHLFPAEEEERFSLVRGYEAILTLMENGDLEPKRLITHRFPYEQMAEAYEMAFRREKSMLGVLFEWS